MAFCFKLCLTTPVVSTPHLSLRRGLGLLLFSSTALSRMEALLRSTVPDLYIDRFRSFIFLPRMEDSL